MLTTLASLLHAFFLTLAVPDLALATHVECTYKPGNKTPYTYDYALFCTAQRYWGEHKGAEWRCDGRGTGNAGTRVGTWGFLIPNKIEVMSPCGDGGYGVNRFDSCYGPLWAFCLGDSNLGNCYYLSSIDDCEWPYPMDSDHLPKTVEIWYRYN